QCAGGGASSQQQGHTAGQNAPIFRPDATVEPFICEDQDLSLEQAHEQQDTHAPAGAVQPAPEEKRLGELRHFNVASFAIDEQSRERQVQHGQQGKKRAAAEYDQNIASLSNFRRPVGQYELPDD